MKDTENKKVKKEKKEKPVKVRKEKVRGKSRLFIVLHIIEMLYALAVLGWYAIPYYLPGFQRMIPLHLPFQLFTFEGGGVLMFILSVLSTYLLPVVCCMKLVSMIFRKRLAFLCDAEKFLPILLNIITSGILVTFILLYIQKYAINIQFFFTLSPYTYALAGVSIVYNVLFDVFMVRYFRRGDAHYQEYLEFNRMYKNEKGSIIKMAIKVGIQKKLLFSFIGLIFILLIGLSSILLVDFSHTILASVFDSGNSIAERSASVIKTNIDDEIALAEYLSTERKRNESSEFKFKSISFYQKQKTGEFTIALSTNEKLVGNKLDEKYLKVEKTLSEYNSADNTYEFISPIILSNKILGYSMVVYDRDTIFETYFKTQVKAAIFSFIFMYLSIILVYIFGSRIVFPLLFLRMNVNKLGSTLTKMLKGQVKVSANLLTYDDAVKTKDEIKTLSTEINDMTNVIKGVIPYISTSTFTNVEHGKTVSQIRELSFLFTDIRGFTTLCEGLSPSDVVNILNRYLDIQASIIMNHNGDIDKFVGDEMMATFDGPEKEINACRASMDIRTAMAEEKEKRLKNNEKIVEIGIGINSGPVVFGSVGAKERMDFTSIGDTVNLAARLEGANKSYSTKALITEVVYEKVKDEYLCREIDMLTVKGKNEPVRIFEVLQQKGKDNQKLLKLKELFETGLDYYRQKKWASALKCFSQLEEEYKDGTSSVFIKRIELFKNNPPPKNWDGVFNLTVK